MPTASECHAQAMQMVAASETADSLYRDLQGYDVGPAWMPFGPYAESVRAAARDENETLRALADICNQLAEELFNREQQCIQYTNDMAAYRSAKGIWDSKSSRWHLHPETNPHPGPEPELPVPPFVGAEEGE